MEIWRDIKDYENEYSVSNKGRVLSKRNNKILKTGNCRGYLIVTLYKNSVKKTFSVHRLVAYAFIRKTDETKTEVNHIDFNKKNNSVCNLEWVNHKENMQHSKHYIKIKYLRNENHPKSKLSNEDALKIRELHKIGFKNNYLARKFNVSKNCMSRLLRNKTYNL